MIARLVYSTLCLIASLALSCGVAAHPLAPGLLALTETQPGEFQSIWKLPNKTADKKRLTPRFPDNCRAEEIQAPVAAGTGRSQSFKLRCHSPLFEEIIGITGMTGNSSGVLLRIKFLDGSLIHQMLNAQNNLLVIPDKQSAGEIFTRYLQLGIEHLLAGIDHVLFVITLAILVGWTRQLFWTVTLFTVGHSITLSLTALGLITFPVAIIEAMIALSIAWAAADIIDRENHGVLKRRPWLMSGGFGLLHGMGFASALAEIGLPQQALTLSLAAFNIGIEIGQLLIITLFFTASLCLRRLPVTLPERVLQLTCYVIGSTAAVWFWQRLLG